MPQYAGHLMCFWTVLRKGIADGTFKKDSNPYLIRSMLMGTIEHLFIHWHMQGMPKRKTSIADMLDPLIEIILDGIRAKKEDSGTTLYLKLEDANALEKLFQKKDGGTSSKDKKQITILTRKGVLP